MLSKEAAGGEGKKPYAVCPLSKAEAVGVGKGVVGTCSPQANATRARTRKRIWARFIF